MALTKILRLALALLVLPIVAIAQSGGIRGKVVDVAGEPLAFTTIFVQETDNGSSSNELGQYAIKLAPGRYTVLYQFLGYAAQVKEIEVGLGMSEINVILIPQTYSLGGVDIGSKAEDPAYTVMRKAIALSKFHRLQYDSYDATVYIKGTGRVLKVPRLFKKALEDEGLDSTNAFASESVSQVHFEQPNTLTEKVVSIRKVGNDRSTSPMQYVAASFYAPKLQEAVSPLSPKAFAYYKFTLEGTFQDRDNMVNKIRVTPRSRGEGVFTGWIYIIEDLWSIHSLNLTTLYQGFQLNARQIYRPVKEDLWMPVSHHFSANGKIYGFEGEFDYLVTMNYGQVTLNPDLVGEIEVVDVKVEDEPAKGEKAANLSEALSEKPVTKKELRKMIQNYEKEERKQAEAPRVVLNRSFTIDSSAYDRDSSYWEEVRPIPLTDFERKGYQVQDSMQVAYEEKIAKDSSKTAFSSKFNPFAIISGGRIKLSESSKLQIFRLRSYYSTVDGFYLITGGRYSHEFDSTHSLSIAPRVRYAFKRESLNANAIAKYRWGDKLTGSTLSVEGGRYVRQIDPSEPISELLNSVYTLFAERNYLKFYERDYMKLGYLLSPQGRFGLSAHINWEQRRQLFNNTDYRIIDRKDISFTDNSPVSIELPNTDFPDHTAVTLDAEFTWRPGVRYFISNGNRIRLSSDKPELALRYWKGISDVLGGDTDFDRLELGVKGKTSIGARAKLTYMASAGSFLNSSNLYFPDYAHFGGNQTIILPTEFAGSFRGLPYYLFSTDDEYLEGHLDVGFRKLLITQLWFLRFAGLKEHLFTNHLYTDAAGHYFEIGYALDNVFRLARLEIAATFQDGDYREMAWFRIGLSSRLFSVDSGE